MAEYVTSLHFVACYCFTWNYPYQETFSILFHIFQEMPLEHQFDELLSCTVNIALKKMHFPILQLFTITFPIVG